MSQPAVEVRGLTKRFRRSGGRPKQDGHRLRAPWRRPPRKDLVALHPLDLDLERGAITGVIGPNGSGKSTLVRILATLVLPDAGWARVFGLDVFRRATSLFAHERPTRIGGPAMGGRILDIAFAEWRAEEIA